MLASAMVCESKGRQRVGTQGRCKWNNCWHPEQPLNSRFSSIHSGNGKESSVTHFRAIAFNDSLNVNTVFPTKYERTWSWEETSQCSDDRPDFSSIKSPREKNKKVKETAYGPSSVKNQEVFQRLRMKPSELRWVTGVLGAKQTIWIIGKAGTDSKKHSHEGQSWCLKNMTAFVRS